MDQKFERVKGVPRLYKRQYMIGSGDVSTKFYALFVCRLKGKRRCFPLGGDLRTAREALKILEADNIKGKDFDAEREERGKAAVAGMTLGEWLDTYLDKTKEKDSRQTDTVHCAKLKRLMGSLPLAEINRPRIAEYKTRRLSEPIMRHGKPVEGTTVAGSTVNRELAFLSAALNFAADDGLCDGMPKKVKREKEFARERTLTDDEYKHLLEAAPRWLQRCMIAANETALDRGVLLALTWDSMRDGLINIKRPKTDTKQRVGISPMLREVLDELRAEFRRIPNTERCVFTKDGRTIPQGTLRKAFDKAVSNAGIQDFQFRDFRHCARSRWASLGLPYEVAEGGLGHKLPGMAGRYTNLTDGQVREAFDRMFEKMLTGCQHENAANQPRSVSY